LLEGYVDLVFDGPDGMEIVDYKTDVISREEIAERMNGYGVQGEAYRAAIETATKSQVPRVTFVFVSVGEEVVLLADGLTRDRLMDRLNAI
jgi:ATP-dependent exoDNAse (exonuclease V) beta subunit